MAERKAQLEERLMLLNHQLKVEQHQAEMQMKREMHQQAMALKDDTDVQQSIAIARLMAGELRRCSSSSASITRPGESRFAESGIPRWMGEDLTGKKIIVAHEQGYGDTIQFARFIPDWRRAGYLVGPGRSLRDLINENFEFAEMVGEMAHSRRTSTARPFRSAAR
jgi:hypothetical protein